VYATTHAAMDYVRVTIRLSLAEPVLSSELLSGCIRSSSGGEPDSLDRGVRLGLDCTLGDLKPRLGASPKVSGSGSGLMPAKQWVVLRNAVL
jgi:hypothetical protein